MDEKTTNETVPENPFKPLICHKIIRRRDSIPSESLCGVDALRYCVIGTPRKHMAPIPFRVHVWLCKKHAALARKQGYTLE